MVQGKFFSGNDDLTDIMNIRKRVFQEEPGSDSGTEEEALDKMCMHVLAYNKGVPVAAGRIYYDGWSFVISKVAVLKEHRNQMYGDFIVRMLIDRAMMCGTGEIKLKTPESCVAFFKTIGFERRQDVEQSGQTGEWTEMFLDPANIHKCCDCSSQGR